MIQDYFINEIVLKKREETIVYEDGISKVNYETKETTIKCRVSHLNYKDLQFLDGVKDIQENIKKLYTEKNVEIDVKDIIVRENKEYKIIAEYKPQDKKNIHHKKFFIKIIS